MTRRRKGLSQRGLVYCLAFESAPGTRLTTEQIGAELRKRGLLRATNTTLYRALERLEQARMVSRDRGRSESAHVVWVRQELPGKLSVELLRMRGAPWRAAMEILHCLEADKLVELKDDGLFHDTSAA